MSDAETETAPSGNGSALEPRAPKSPAVGTAPPLPELRPNDDIAITGAGVISAETQAVRFQWAARGMWAGFILGVIGSLRWCLR